MDYKRLTNLFYASIVVCMETEIMEKYLFLYKSWKKVYCPALKTYVLFTRGGWNHLFINKKRTKDEQIRRLKILPISRKILSITTTIQEIRHNKGYTSYEFIAVLEGSTVACVISESKGVYYFLSNYVV